MMATWTPGSYLIREYSKNVEHVQARTTDGKKLPVGKTAKNRWTVDCPSVDEVHVEYKLYGHEMSVRGNWIEQDLTILNGAPTFIVDAQHPNQPAYIVLPEDVWPAIHTALPMVDGRYFASDLDTLLDSPWVMGDTATYEFQINGVEHELVNWGEAGIWDGPKSAKDVETITQSIVDFWGEIPYNRYLYLNVMAESGGGLEHKESTLMLTSRWNSNDREDYLNWLGLVSHEFFHTWNVKRLRPESLGPFDYENENYTRSLWVAEGITSYYDDLLLVRAGLMTETEYLKRLSKQITNFQSKPGRHTRSLEEVSFDAWIKHYRKDENTINTAVSYYSKGAVVAWLLDMKIRAQTKGQNSLDDVMRAAWTDFSGARGFTPEHFQATAERVAKTSLNEFFEKYVRGTEELDYTAALEWTGLQMENPSESDELWLGLETSGGGGGVRVTGVHKGSPAFQADLIVGDEILAINDFRVRPSSFTKRLKQLSTDEGITLLVSRRGRVSTLSIQAEAKPQRTWTLSSKESAGKTANRQRQHWFEGTSP